MEGRGSLEWKVTCKVQYYYLAIVHWHCGVGRRVNGALFRHDQWLAANFVKIMETRGCTVTGELFAQSGAVNKNCRMDEG